MNYVLISCICFVLALQVHFVKGQGAFPQRVEDETSIEVLGGFVTGVAIGRASVRFEEEEEEEKEEDGPCRNLDCGDNGVCCPNEESEEEAECLCKEGFCGPRCSPLSEVAASANEMCPSGVCITFGSTCIDGECFCNCSRKLVGLGSQVFAICAPECEFSNQYIASTTARFTGLVIENVDVDNTDARSATQQCIDACNSNPDCAAFILAAMGNTCQLLPIPLNQVAYTINFPNTDNPYFERICN